MPSLSKGFGPSLVELVGPLGRMCSDLRARFVWRRRGSAEDRLLADPCLSLSSTSKLLSELGSLYETLVVRRALVNFLG